MSKPLRVAIHDLVVSYLLTRLATNEHVDVAELTLEIAQSLVCHHGASGQGALFAFALTSLGEEYLQRKGLFDTYPKGH
jgi:hypothetical protein